ncbi:ABC transporter permease [Paenibacillus sp. MMS20-IR301]|uniref:ABC transporter permease n=1 Tax=Paenibacillus sp. MMS20-IR301 TaxID=2895946 RepID=UPI0028E63182|nr:ABC transporter permease [Paenibacillus sp. MMS20-IR301]WNS43707.1 ABC transporter permease [Paenibacillus sp. MMS20-IR301]
MINLLKMDWHRFRRNKIMYLLLLIFCAFQIFGIYMMQQYAQPPEEGGIQIGSLNESDFIQYTISQPPSWMLIYIAVFTVYFYMSEWNSGFYKNYISMRKARIYSVLSKIVILGVFVSMMFLTLLIADWIGRRLFLGNTDMGDFAYLLKLLSSQFLLHWAFSLLILCIAMIAKNLLVSLTAGFILALNVIGMLLAALESQIGGVQLTKYLLISTIVRVKDFNSAADTLHTAGVAVTFILLCGLLAVRYKIKEDLN